MRTVASGNCVTESLSGLTTLHLPSGNECCFPNENKKRRQENYSQKNNTACLLDSVTSTKRSRLLPILEKVKNYKTQNEEKKSVFHVVICAHCSAALCMEPADL